MQKLLNAYRATPSLKNAMKLRAYERSHPFVACIYPDDKATMANAIHHANCGTSIAP
jgi:hypothetical protein